MSCQFAQDIDCIAHIASTNKERYVLLWANVAIMLVVAKHSEEMGSKSTTPETQTFPSGICIASLRLGKKSRSSYLAAH
ncbi:hypothetical protein K443DRAFT_639631 [Laccaria amethystina LaAM-08-1]|uniref:Uncharacterized protein n=1 Tax=Laccaria amethystina LaAM-08-1 TaxID=1095629 RepID=A0A0C9XBL5_9AGAR|nr:hypothetical protein K443DRAFT_639631 [Laccaria amethystina LaAM-08-1]